MEAYEAGDLYDRWGIMYDVVEEGKLPAEKFETVVHVY